MWHIEEKSRNSKDNLIFLLDSLSLIYNFINMMKGRCPSPGECEIDFSPPGERPLPGVRHSRNTLQRKCKHTLMLPLTFPEIHCDREGMDLSKKGEMSYSFSPLQMEPHVPEEERSVGPHLDGLQLLWPEGSGQSPLVHPNEAGWVTSSWSMHTA